MLDARGVTGSSAGVQENNLAAAGEKRVVNRLLNSYTLLSFCRWI